jgi:hypothetical protein
VFDVKVTTSLTMATVGEVDYAAYTAIGKTYGTPHTFVFMEQRVRGVY